MPTSATPPTMLPSVTASRFRIRNDDHVIAS
jgi:hypothetical protein